VGLISLPDPVSIIESAKTAGLEREVINSLISAAYSVWITGMWRSGSSKWALLIGEGQAMQDAAVAMYLTLTRLESKKFLTLTVPEDMLVSNNLSKFQTEQTTK